MRRVKRFFGVLFFIINFSLGFYVAYNLFGKSHFTLRSGILHSVHAVGNKKLNLESAIFESFLSKRELIILEVELSDIVEWDDSWGTLGVFHKSQRIRFFGTGAYITDLNLIAKNDIQVNVESKIVNVALSKPIVKSVTIHEDKTEYESVEKGWLRFGNISVTPEQYNDLYALVKDNMRNNLEGPESKKKAEENTETCIIELFHVIMDALEEGYSIKITWK